MSKNNNNKTLYLTDYNANDKPWDEHRGQCDDVGGLYAAAAEFERYAERMSNCSGLLRFGWSNNLETGETRLEGVRKVHACGSLITDLSKKLPPSYREYPFLCLLIRLDSVKMQKIM